MTIYEQTEVRSLRPGVVETARGTVRAATVVRATEGYTRTLPRRAAHPGAGVLADDRHRAAARPRSGTGPAWPDGRPSPTTAIWSSTVSAPRTAAWPSAAGGRPTTSGRPSGPEYDRDARRARGPAAHAGRPVPGPGRRRDHPPVGRAARDRPGLVHLGRARPGHRGGLGRRVRGRRGVHHQSGRSDPAGPHPPAGHRPRPRCPGSATGPSGGSRSRCAISGSTPGCGWRPAPITPRSGPAGPPGTPPHWTGSSAASWRAPGRRGITRGRRRSGPHSRSGRRISDWAERGGAPTGHGGRFRLPGQVWHPTSGQSFPPG